MQVTRHRTVLELGAKCLSRGFPVAFVGLKAQQRVLRFNMARLDGKRLLGKLERCIHIAIGKTLAHQATHTDKPGFVVGQQALVNRLGLLGIAHHFSGLCRDQIGQVRATQIALGLVGLRDRGTAFARG